MKEGYIGTYLYCYLVQKQPLLPESMYLIQLLYCSYVH